MVKIHHFTFVMLILSSCAGTQATKEKLPSVIMTTLYENEYINDTLLSRVITKYYGNNTLESTYETLYSYDDSGKLISEKQYDIDSTTKRLYMSDITNGNIRKVVYLSNRKDTTSISVHDSDKLVWRRERDIYITESYKDYEISIKYNKDGSSLEDIKYDYAHNEATRTLFYYNDEKVKQPISKFSSSLKNNKTEIVRYVEKHVGDTLVKYRYVNDTLANVYKTVEQYNYELVLYYDGLGTLTQKRDVIKIGDITSETINVYDPNSTENIFYEDGLEVKRILILDTSKSDAFYEYDKNRNLLKETRLVYFDNE